MPIEAFPHDPANRPGYWGEVTSTVQWCESDYVHSFYIAEYFNTISSLPIALVAAWGLYSGWRAGWQGKTLLPFFLMLCVGVGSCCFHGTLQRWGQAADELPMLYAATTLLYLGLEPARTTRRAWLAPALAVFCAATSAAYIMLDAFFPFFLSTYIVLVLAQFYYALVLAAEAQTAQPGAQRLLASAAIIYLLGFFCLWVPDYFHCQAVQPFCFHAWFHLTSCAGPWALVNFFALCIHQRSAPAQSPPLLQYHYCVPIVVISSDTEGKRGTALPPKRAMPAKRA